jgi:hypothetical protein
MANQTLSSRLNVGVAQIVVPGTSSGLVSASGLTGNTTGSAIASGFVGEWLHASPASVVVPSGSGGITGVASLTLTAGDWDVWGHVTFGFGTSSGNTYLYSLLSTTSGGGGAPYSGNADSFGSMVSTAVYSGIINPRSACGPIRVSSSTSVTVYLNAQVNYSAIGTGGFQTDSIIQARRRA